MKCIFYINDSPREQRIARSMLRGVQAHGDTMEIRARADYGEGRKYGGPDLYADCNIAYGVKSRDILFDHHNAGANWAIFDKGYLRAFGPHRVELYTRVCVNEAYPLNWFKVSSVPPPDRWEDIANRAGVALGALRNPTRSTHILVCGSSQKFYAFFGVGAEDAFHSKLIRRIKKNAQLVSHLPVRFRPKPSYEKRHGGGEELLLSYGAHSVSMPSESIHTALRGAHCLVTFASNSACDALLAGVPAVVLGPHVSKTVAESDLSNLHAPYFPDDQARYDWCSRLAYEMHTLEEMASGWTWGEMKKRLALGPSPDGWWDLKRDPIPGWNPDSA